MDACTCGAPPKYLSRYVVDSIEALNLEFQEFLARTQKKEEPDPDPDRTKKRLSLEELKSLFEFPVDRNPKNGALLHCRACGALWVRFPNSSEMQRYEESDQ